MKNTSTAIILALLLATPFVAAALIDNDYVLLVANSTGNNSTTFFDVSGNFRNATIEGNPTFSAYQGYGFNTTNHNSTTRVYYPFGQEWAVGGQNNSWSVYGWFRPTNGATGQGTVWATSFNSYDNRSTCQMNAGTTGVFACGIFNGSDYVGVKSCLITNDGLPHSFYYGWNRTTNTSTLYCDNIISATTTGSLNTGAAQRTYLGQRTDNAQSLNGTIFWIGASQKIRTTAEISEVYNYGYNFLNSTPPVANNYVNITIGSTSVRTLPANFRGLDVHPVAGFPYYESNGSLRNNTLDNLVINSFDPTAIRDIIDLPNQCTSYTGNPTNPCSFPTINTSNYQNINLHRSILSNASAQGRKYYVNQDGMPRWLADNSSKCDYGATNGATYFNYTTCDPSNYTIYANAVAQYMEALGCTTTYAGVCVLEGWNEPYLSSNGGSAAGVGIFYYRNRTVDCTQRTAGQMALWNNTFPIYSARLGSAVEYLSPSFNYGYSSCGVSMGNTFMAQHSYGGNASPDYMNTHEYSSSNPPALITDISTAQAAFTAGGWGAYWKTTEGNINNGGAGNPPTALCNTSPEVCSAALTTSQIYLISNTTNQGWVWYDYDTDESYSTYDYPDQLYTPNFLKPTGLMLNATKYIDDTSGTVRTCTVTGDSDVTCAYVQVNSTKGVLIISNYQNSTTLVQNVTITSGNVTGAVSNTNGSMYAAGSGVVQNIVLGRYGFDGYNITYETADTTPPTLTNRSEWSNSNTLQVNVTCNEACNASINFGTDFLVLGNKSNITAFSLTNQSWNLTPLFNNTNYHYNITVCDTLNNCATYGIYSEFTKNTSVTNISFSSTTPGNSSNIAEPNNITFAYSINNPFSLPTTTVWRVNGTVQTETGTSFLFGNNYTSAGNWTINVTVAAMSANTISYQWSVLINDTPSISYSSTSPGTPFTIAEPQGQVFAVVVDNPDALTLTYEWLVNGTNVSTAYNLAQVTFTGGYDTAGVYNITNKVYSSAGTLNYTWILTVTETNQTTSISASTACYNTQESMVNFARFFNLLAIAIVGLFIAFAIWKFYSAGFAVDMSFFVIMTMAIIVAGILLAIGAVIVSGAAATCI